jgi:hypothetical protein
MNTQPTPSQDTPPIVTAGTAEIEANPVNEAILSNSDARIVLAPSPNN